MVGFTVGFGRLWKALEVISEGSQRGSTLCVKALRAVCQSVIVKRFSAERKQGGTRLSIHQVVVSPCALVSGDAATPPRCESVAAQPAWKLCLCKLLQRELGLSWALQGVRVDGWLGARVVAIVVAACW